MRSVIQKHLLISLTKKNKRTRRQNKRKRRIKQKNKRTKRKNKRKRTRIKKKKQLQDKIKEEQKSKFAKELLSYVSSISMPANHIKYFVKKMIPTL